MNPNSPARLLPPLVLACLASACSTIGIGRDGPESVSGPVRELPCEELASLRSVDSVGQIRLSIENLGAEPLSLYWVNYDGEEEPAGTVAPGNTIPVNTYFTHPWVLRNTPGDCIAVYVSSDTAEIRIDAADRS